MAQVTYKISGKHDPKGVNDAKKSLDSLGKAVNSINSIVKAFAGIKIFDKLKQTVNETTAEFTKNQTALNRMATGIASNAKLAGGAFDRLTQKVDRLAKTSMFGGDELANQAAFLSGMNLTEEAIGNVLQAAVDLSHAGIGDLNDNIKKLSDTFNGNITQLGKVIPEFQTLTKEELKAGMAIDVVKSKFKGFADAWSEETSEGTGKQFREVIDDIKSSVGGIFSRVEDEGMKILIPILERVSDWFAENGPNIAAHMIAGMKVLETIIKNIANNLPHLLTPKTWGNFFTHASNLAKSFALFFGNTLKDVFINSVDVLKWALGNVDIIKILWTPFLELLKSFGAVGRGAAALIEKGIDAASEALAGLAGTRGHEFPEYRQSDKSKAAQDEFFKNLRNAADFVLDTIAGTDASALFASELEKVLRKFESPYERSPRTDPVVTGSKAPDAEKPRKEEKSFGENLFDSFTESLSHVGVLIKDITTSFIDGNIVLSAVGSAMGALSSASENFAAVLNFLDTIFTEMATIIGPLINELFAPLVSFLQQIGRILANIIAGVLEPLIQILEPIFLLISSVLTILEVVSSSLGGIIKVIGFLLKGALAPFMAGIEALSALFMLIYNYVLRPVLWAIQNAVAVVYNAIATVFNALASAVNWIPGVNIKKMSKMSYADFDDMYLDKNALEGENEANGGSYANQSSASGSASYTAARDIYVYINYYNSYVNGDSREIALNLRDEIRAAEILGL